MSRANPLRMILRITPSKADLGTVLRIDGQLVGGNVKELDRACQLAAGPFLIDLANLRSVDSTGARALKSLVQRGAKLINVSEYIRMLLEIEG